MAWTSPISRGSCELLSGGDLRDIQPRVTLTQKPSGWAVVVLIPGVGVVGDRFLGGNAATHQDAARFIRLLVEEVRRMVRQKAP